MSQDKTYFRQIKRKIDRTRQALAELGELTSEKDLAKLIAGMGDLLEENGFGRDPFDQIKEEVSSDIDGTVTTKRFAPVLHDYLENGEPSASQYAAQAIIYAKRTLELLSAEPSKKVMQDLVFNSLRAQQSATLADFRATKKEQDLRSGFLSRTSNRQNPDNFGKYQDKLSKREALVKQAKKFGKDAIAYVAEKEGISLQGAERYLKKKNLLDN